MPLNKASKSYSTIIPIPPLTYPIMLFWNISPVELAAITNNSLDPAETGIFKSVKEPVTILFTGTFPVRVGVKFNIVPGISVNVLFGVSDIYNLAEIVTSVFVKSEGMLVEKKAVNLSIVPSVGIEKA